MADRTVRVELLGDSSSLVAAAERARVALSELSRVDTSAAGRGLRDTGAAAQGTVSAFDKLKSSMAAQVGVANIASQLTMAGFFAIKAAITDTIKATTDYQTTLFTLQAVTHASGDTMVGVASKARELGKDITIPGASATDAAKAMTELAKGGLTVQQSMAAAKGTLLLAAAATVTASQAAEVEVNTLNAYHLAATEAGHVSDVLANAANQASGEMTDFAAGLKMAGTTAHGMGISLEDTTTVLGLFANAGIKGEMGGTLLNTMLVRLAAPTAHAKTALAELGVTAYDANGNFEGMQAVTDQLRVAHEKLTPAVYAADTSIAFGTRGIRGAMILGDEAASSFGLMKDAIVQNGGAADLAGAKMQGLEGSFQNLTNQVQDTQLAVGLQLAPALTDTMNVIASLVGYVGSAVNWFEQLPGPVKLGALALGAVILLKGPLVSLFDTVALKAMYSADAVSAAGGIMKWSMAGVEVGAKAMWTAIGGWVGVGIAAVTTAFTLFSGSTEQATIAASDFTAAIDQNTGALTKSAAQVIAKNAADTGALDAYTAIGGKVGDYTAALMGNVSAQDTVHTAILDAATAAVSGATSYDTAGNAMKLTDAQARGLASSILATGDAGSYQSDQLNAVLLASRHLADQSGTLTTEQTHVMQAIAGAGDAAGGATGQQQALKDAITQSLDPAQNMNTALKDFKTQADFATTAGNFLWASLQELSHNEIDAEHRTRLTEAALRDMAASARAAGEANINVANASAKTSDAQQKLDDLTSHLGGTLNGQAVSASNLVVTQEMVDQASRDLATAQNAEATAHDNVSKAQDTQADSTTKASRAIIDQAGTAYVLKAATGDMQGAIDAASTATEAGRQSFIAAAEQMGYNEADANTLADKYHLIPGEVVTNLKQQGMDEAQQKVDALNKTLEGMNNKVYKFTVQQDGTVVAVNASGSPLAGPPVYMQAAGGLITGPGGPRDDLIPAMLSNREFVVNAMATEKHLPLLHAINAGHFANGGIVTNTLESSYLAGTNYALTLPKLNYPAPPVSAATGNIPSAGSGVEQWRGIVDQGLAILGQPQSLDNTVLYQMQTESGGNPNAINLTDINAQNGVPSKGLVQVIDPTFRSYAVPPYNQNIWDPLSNVLAGINYAIHQYGSIAAGMRGVAYAAGGIVPGNNPGYDTVPAWLSPGEAVISRAGGSKDANKAYLNQAASWFGGQVTYPGGDRVPVMANQAPQTVVHIHHHTGSSGVQVGAINNYGPSDVVSALDYASMRL